MTWNFKADRPIYTQLVEQISLSILSGRFKPGEKLPSVRDLAAEAGVNPNTMQRAMAELEQAGLLYTQRTAGRFITEEEGQISAMKNELAMRHVAEFLKIMDQIGFTNEEAAALILNNNNKEE